MSARSSTVPPPIFSTLARLGRLGLGGTVLLLALNLGACGNKGSLYLPENPGGRTATPTDSAAQDERDR